MSTQLKYLFVFVFLSSVFSITLQASIINFCKENKVFKSQSTPVSEEEENHDTDEEVDEVIYLNNYTDVVHSFEIKKMLWDKSESRYLSYTKSIPIPPPKF